MNAPIAPAPEAPAFEHRLAVATYLLPRLLDRLAEIDELRSKRGLTACGYDVTIGEPYTVKVNTVAGWEERTFADVVIAGSFPRLPGGWTYAGVIERPNGATRNLVHGPLAEMPELATMDLRCDHCGTKRDRRLSVLARNDEGELKVIGRSCAADYFGLGADPASVLRSGELFGGFDEEFGGAGRHPDLAATEHLLASAHAVLRTHAWASKGSAGDFATAVFAGYRINLTPKPKFYDDIMAQTEWEDALAAVGKTDEVDYVAARELIRWAAEDLDPGTNDFLNNVVAVLSAPAVDARHSGIAVAGWVALENWLGRKAEAEAKAADRATDADTSTHLGEVGERLELTGEVIFTRWFESNYGGSTLVKVRTDDGNIVTTFSSGAFGNATKGDTLRFRGTVQEHTEFNGVAETKLSRCATVKTKETA